MEPQIRYCTTEDGVSIAYLADDGVRLQEVRWTNG
jgi:hypothetical protein